MAGRILVIDHKTPRPDQDSGSASTFAFLQGLVNLGFEVRFAPFDLRHDGRYTEDLAALGVRPLTAPKWRSIDAVVKQARECDVVLLYRAPIAAQLFDRVRKRAPGAKIVFHAVDLHFLRMEREAALSGVQADYDEAAAMRLRELDLVGRADMSIVVSAYERDLLGRLTPTARVRHLPIIREVPPESSLGGVGGSRQGVLFIGGYEHRPNVDAMTWFVSEVWPCVRLRRLPERLIIAGSKVPDGVAALASQDIEIRGYVDDLAATFAACKLSIAPLRYGGGIKGKIVTSLSYGVPVVATSVAAEGMGLVHEEHVLVADEPAAFADQIARLCADTALWQRLAANGRRFFMDNFSLQAGTARIREAFDELASRP